MHKTRGLLTDRQAGKVNALKQGSTVFAMMRGLAMRLNGILRSRNSEALDEWIDDAIDTELTAIMRFASVLRRDIDAVKNAIELLWSDGQAEGQINRLNAEASNVRSRRPRTDEGENAAAESQKLRMIPITPDDFEAAVRFVIVRHFWLMGEYASRAREWGATVSVG